MTDLDALNVMDAGSFAATLDPVFENAPHIAHAAWPGRPFATVTALHDALFAIAQAQPEPDRIAFLQGHPDLAGAAARTRQMTDASIAEQGALGLDALPDAAFARFAALNDAYRTRFGFPFIICVRRHTRASILAEFTRRLAHDPASEQAAAFREIFLITRLRLAALVQGPGMPAVNGELSTHVLDTATGRPGAHIGVTLLEMEGNTGQVICQTTTDADGRTERPLIADTPLRIGTYELHFAVASYFASQTTATLPFLDIIKLRFSLAEPEGNYHVPLLLTPWGYTTYRGS